MDTALWRQCLTHFSRLLWAPPSYLPSAPSTALSEEISTVYILGMCIVHLSTHQRQCSLLSGDPPKHPDIVGHPQWCKILFSGTLCSTEDVESRQTIKSCFTLSHLSHPGTQCSFLRPIHTVVTSVMNDHPTFGLNTRNPNLFHVGSTVISHSSPSAQSSPRDCP